MTVTRSNVTLAILAGGQGSRMGRPKAELTVSGQPILQYLMARLNWQGPTLLITAPDRRHPPGASLFTREIPDPIAGQGPLRGLITALTHCATQLLVLAGVDMPAISEAHCRWLIEQIESRPHVLGVLPSRIAEGTRQIEPFPSVYRTNAANVVAEHFESGNRSIYSLTHLPTFVVAETPSEWGTSVWTNVNTPQEFDAWL